MKKLFIVVLAAIGMVSCMNTDEVIEVSNGDAIAFADAFIENSVRATAYDNGNLNHFNVWGTVTANGATAPIFAGTKVTKANGIWGYEGATQYWVKNLTYNFRALVDGEAVVENNMLTGVNVDINDQQDVLVAEDMNVTYDGSKQYVDFTFSHLLSKVKFTFENTITATDAYSYVVEDVKVEASKSATYDLENNTWGNYSTEKTAVAFGGAEAILTSAAKAESQKEQLLIPSAESKKITFTLKLMLGGVMLSNETKTIETDLKLVAGNAYNFVVALGEPGEPIKFTATVLDWDQAGDQTYVPGTVNVSSAASFAEKFVDEEVGEITLISDIDLDELAALTRAEGDDVKLTVSAGKSLSINLNGHKLSATSTNDSKNYDMILVKGNLTVKNGTIETKHEGQNMGWGAMTTIFDVTAGGVLNLEGVTAKNLGGSDMAFVAHLNNWGEVTLNVENSTLESTYVPVRVFNSGNDMNNVTIKNSTLKGVSAAFWVHNYTVEDFGTQAKADAQKALLNLAIYDNGNTFSPDVNGIRYGFTNSVRSDAYGITKTVSEDGTEVTLGSLVEDGLIRRGVAGDEKNTTIKKAVVGEGVTTLYDRTFRCFYALETVELPSTLTTIGAAGSGVFQSCTALKNIVLPESVTVLGKGTFQECAALESINIPAGVTRIEENCLRNTGLKSVEFHEGVTYFGPAAFRDCENLEDIYINAPAFTVESNTFLNASAPYPAFNIHVTTLEMVEYLNSKLSNHEKTFITVVGPKAAANVAQLAEALAEGKEVILTTNIAVAQSEAVSNGYGVVGVQQLNGGVINGNGNSFSVNAWGTWDSAINTTGGTIKNLNVTGGMRGIFISHNSSYSDKVILDNVTIDGTIYTISCDQGTNKGLEAYNSTFKGWTSYAATLGDVKFEGCSFGEGQGYAFCRPYAPTAFVNCAFAAGFELDAQAAVTFENCTIGGVALTAENLSTLVSGGIANATVK